MNLFDACLGYGDADWEYTTLDGDGGGQGDCQEGGGYFGFGIPRGDGDKDGMHQHRPGCHANCWAVTWVLTHTDCNVTWHPSVATL